MNLDRVVQFAVCVAATAYVAGRLPQFNQWVSLQTIKLLYSSRTATWGSPVFFTEP
jgi:hypothetical protein